MEEGSVEVAPADTAAEALCVVELLCVLVLCVPEVLCVLEVPEVSVGLEVFELELVSVLELLDELPGTPVTAPLLDASERKDWELGGWMLVITWLRRAPDFADRKPIPSGGGITIPIFAARRSMR